MLHLPWLTRFRLFTASLILAVALGGACNCEDDDDDTTDAGIDVDADDDGDVDDEDVDDEDVGDGDADDPDPDIPEGLARVQIIHDSPDPDAAIIDLYADDDLLVDDFEFRTATPYLDIDAGTYDFTIAADDSTDVDDGLVTFSDIEFSEQRRYLVVAGGVIAAEDFADNPDGTLTDLTLHRLADTREESDDADLNQILLFHSAPDAPQVDLVADNATTLVSELGYGEFSDGYLSLPPGISVFDILLSASGDRFGSYQTPDLADGDAYTALASGFVDDSQNAEAGFEIIVYPTTVGGDRLDAIILDEAARLQLVHNSVDPAAEQIDLFLNGELLAEEIGYRSATPFLTFPSNMSLDFAITAAGAGDPDDSVLAETLSFDPGSTQLAVASGVATPGDFPDNPDGRDTELALYSMADARESAIDDDLVDIVAFHGVLDAQEVSVVADVDGAEVDVSSALAYGEFSDYASAPDLSDIGVSLLPTSPPPTSLADFTFDLSTLTGQSALIVVSGLLDEDDVVALVVLDDGTTLEVAPD